MRNGFTTGSCAAAAAKAAVTMLLGGSRVEKVKINTPAGVVYEADIAEIRIKEDEVRCGVRKDAGDDPDITDGALIVATVSVMKGDGAETFQNAGAEACRDAGAEARNDAATRIRIEGGEGVGVVTRPGLDQPVGQPAINSVPRAMITEAVSDVMDFFDCGASLRVVLSVPGGAELAEKTMNPRIGIVGGISIIGTSGIVEPMSTRALLETIRLELKQRQEEGARVAVVSPGNYGKDFMRKTYGYDLNQAVKCSNFIGDTIDMVKDLGFQKMLLVGHVGKLIKVSGGIMNTHSAEADCRMELLTAAAVRSGASADTVRRILDCVSTEEACDFLAEEGIEEACFSDIMKRISYYLNKRAGEGLDVQCMMYSNSRGLLGCTPLAEEYLK